ncbi:MAG: AAA family ATPase [Rothia mucilaginosa]|nr:AAA family ATPase [Rothia mucilaginosa]
MYISKLSIENIKGFYGKTEFKFQNGMNYIVGNNNSGKSTIFDAFNYLYDSKSVDGIYSKESSESSVEICLRGADLEELMKIGGFKKFQDHVYQVDDEYEIRFRRQSKEETHGRKKINERTILVWNKDSASFENITGIDALFKKFFDITIVYADDTPENHLNAASTKTLGKLLSNVYKSIQETSEWSEYVESHRVLFSGSKISRDIQSIENSLNQRLSGQYGNSNLHLNFAIPDASNFVKNCSIESIEEVNNAQYSVPISGKGTGEQRAVMLALLQILADQQSSLSEESSGESDVNNMIFGFDEPETWLHPKAQINLAEALCKISEDMQIFVVTHSPYVIRELHKSGAMINISGPESGEDRVRYVNSLSSMGLNRLSADAVNYYAFDIPSAGFMDELYGHFASCCLHPEGGFANEKEIEKELHLLMPGISLKEWVRESKNGATNTYRIPLCVYVRNSVHHPENSNNPKRYTEEELENSIKQLMDAISLRKKYFKNFTCRCPS